MTPDSQKKPEADDPLGEGASDFGPTMKAAPNGSEFDPRRLSIEDLSDPRTVEEALTHWNELEPPLLTAIESHPQHGPRLAMLRRADHWLDRKGPSLRGAGACPTSEELYDFGRGPGFGPLPNARRGEIERHLRTCADCEKLVETLAILPPVPLDTFTEAVHADGRSGQAERVRSDRLAPEGVTAGRIAPGRSTLEPVAAEEREAIRARRRMRALPRLVPLAAAATVLIGLGLWIAFNPSNPAAPGFPHAQLLRGSSGGPLYYPRDRVLRVTPEVRAAFPALDGSLLFEIEPQADGSSYRVDLARHGADAFAAEEASLLKLTGSAPSIRATIDLAPGEYTWTAVAVVRGLDQVLGARDFSVVDDAGMCRQLADLAGRKEPARSLAAVNLMHEHGFEAEARAIARAMPPSPERDAYLAQVPGR
jgi:hypothetical protein